MAAAGTRWGHDGGNLEQGEHGGGEGWQSQGQQGGAAMTWLLLNID